MENKFIPCSNGQQAQMECLYRVAGSLVEVVGFPIVQYTPQDARSAAQTLWAMADSIEGKKTPRSDAEAVRTLLDASIDVLNDAHWPASADETDALVLTNSLLRLADAYHTLTGDA